MGIEDIIIVTGFASEKIHGISTAKALELAARKKVIPARSREVISVGEASGASEWTSEYRNQPSASP